MSNAFAASLRSSSPAPGVRSGAGTARDLPDSGRARAASTGTGSRSSSSSRPASASTDRRSSLGPSSALSAPAPYLGRRGSNGSLSYHSAAAAAAAAPAPTPHVHPHSFAQSSALSKSLINGYGSIDSPSNIAKRPLDAVRAGMNRATGPVKASVRPAATTESSLPARANYTYQPPPFTESTRMGRPSVPSSPRAQHQIRCASTGPGSGRSPPYSHSAAATHPTSPSFNYEHSPSHTSHFMSTALEKARSTLSHSSATAQNVADPPRQYAATPTTSHRSPSPFRSVDTAAHPPHVTQAAPSASTSNHSFHGEYSAGTYSGRKRSGSVGGGDASGSGSDYRASVGGSVALHITSHPEAVERRGKELLNQFDAQLEVRKRQASNGDQPTLSYTPAATAPGTSVPPYATSHRPASTFDEARAPASAAFTPTYTPPSPAHAYNSTHTGAPSSSTSTAYAVQSSPTAAAARPTVSAADLYRSSPSFASSAARVPPPPSNGASSSSSSSYVPAAAPREPSPHRVSAIAPAAHVSVPARPEFVRTDPTRTPTPAASSATSFSARAPPPAVAATRAPSPSPLRAPPSHPAPASAPTPAPAPALYPAPTLSPAAHAAAALKPAVQLLLKKQGYDCVCPMDALCTDFDAEHVRRCAHPHRRTNAPPPPQPAASQSQVPPTHAHPEGLWNGDDKVQGLPPESFAQVAPVASAAASTAGAYSANHVTAAASAAPPPVSVSQPPVSSSGRSLTVSGGAAAGARGRSGSRAGRERDRSARPPSVLPWAHHAGEFTVMTWNMLSEAYIKPQWYKGYSQRSLASVRRFPLTLHILTKQTHACSVVCMQEVDRTFYEQSIAALEAVGYGHYFAMRIGRVEGLLTLWQTSELTLLGSSTLRLSSSQPQVATFVVLGTRERRVVVVANTHLLGDPTQKHEASSQLRVVTAELQRLRDVNSCSSPSPSGGAAVVNHGRSNTYPAECILCGDFNFHPDSLLYTQARSVAAAHSLPPGALLLESAYRATAGAGHAEPMSTFRTHDKKECVDYIWFSTGDRPVGLKPYALEFDNSEYLFGPQQAHLRYPGYNTSEPLPNEQWPSDHLPVMARFELQL